MSKDGPPEEFTQNDVGSVRPRGEQSPSPERREEIIVAVNAQLKEEMGRLHPGEPFHNSGHLEDVAEDGAAILGIFEKYGMTGENDRLAAEAAANGHDLVIEYTLVNGVRVRHRGFGGSMPQNVKALGVEKGNEELSWLRTQTVIAKFDPDKKVYTDEVLEKIRLGIAATYPEASLATLPPGAAIVVNPENGEQVDLSPYLEKDEEGKPIALKFDQPFLLSESESDLSTFAVAFGDLMHDGKYDAEAFKVHGNHEYQELHESAMQEIRAGVDSISPERKTEIAESMLSWVRSQAGFLLWQKVRFEHIVNTFKAINVHPHTKEIKKDLATLYNKFDQNLLAAKDRIAMSTRFESLKSPRTYVDSPETAQALFAELLLEMGVL